jgi:hypothetical protein
LNGCIQSVEAKFYMRGFGTYLKPQIDRLKEGGLVALYENGKIIAIKTIEDVESITQIESYRIKWKT